MSKAYDIVAGSQILSERILVTESDEPYNGDPDDFVYVEVRFRTDNLKHARWVAEVLEDHVNLLNAEFLETVMEPA